MVFVTLKSFGKGPIQTKIANGLFVNSRYKRRQVETDGALVSELNRAPSEGSRLSSSL